MATAPEPSLTVKDFPDLFLRQREWAEKYPVIEEPEERYRPLCVIINNLKHRGVEHETLRRAFQYSDYEVWSYRNISICTILQIAKVAKLTATREHNLIFYVISDGQCGVLADMCPYKLQISEILDVFPRESRKWWKTETFIFDSNQLLTKEFDDDGEEIPSQHEDQLRFLDKKRRRENQSIILGKVPGEILTFQTINEVKMTSLSWAFTYYLMANHRCPRDLDDVVSNYLLNSQDFPLRNDRRNLMPWFCFPGDGEIE